MSMGLEGARPAEQNILHSKISSSRVAPYGRAVGKKNIISPRLSTNLAPPLTQRSFNPRRLPELSTGSEDDQAHALKRPRLVWTPPLHKRFVDAVSHLGIKNAVPKTIMQLMNVEGLTREPVASHLQKYRLYLKRLRGCSESTMENSPSREGGGSGGGSGEGSGGDARPGRCSRRQSSSGRRQRRRRFRQRVQARGKRQRGGTTGPGADGGAGAVEAGHPTGKRRKRRRPSRARGRVGVPTTAAARVTPRAQSEKGAARATPAAAAATAAATGATAADRRRRSRRRRTRTGRRTGRRARRRSLGRRPPRPPRPAQADKATPRGNSGGEGGASGGEGNGSDDGEERPHSMERASSGDGSNDGAAEANEQGGENRKTRVGSSGRPGGRASPNRRRRIRRRRGRAGPPSEVRAPGAEGGDGDATRRWICMGEMGKSYCTTTRRRRRAVARTLL